MPILGTQVVEWLRGHAMNTADPGSSPGQRAILHVTPPSLSCNFLSLYFQIKASMPEKFQFCLWSVLDGYPRRKTNTPFSAR